MLCTFLGQVTILVTELAHEIPKWSRKRMELVNAGNTEFKIGEEHTVARRILKL